MRLIDAEEGGKRPQKTKGKKETPPAVPAPVEDDSDTDSSDEEVTFFFLSFSFFFWIERGSFLLLFVSST